jgi:hypothetical protein
MLGFVILSHREPAQLLRLTRTLTRLYDAPPIACHHDFSQSDLNEAAFPANVAFVRPSVPTGWGKWGVVDGALGALDLLYRDGGPDWFVLLSAADYPVRPAAEVLEELRSAEVDAFIDFREIGDSHASAQRFGPGNPRLDHFESEGNRSLKQARYVGAQIWLPMLRRSGRGWRLGRYTMHLPFPSPRHPFAADMRGFHGDHWFTANRRVAQLLLSPSPRHLQLRRHLRRRASPDECYYQTVICNEPGLRLSRDNKRFAEWNGGGAHPRELTAREIDAMLSSGAHFARKFAHGSPVLDRLDEMLL